MLFLKVGLTVDDRLTLRGVLMMQAGTQLQWQPAAFPDQ